MKKVFLIVTILAIIMGTFLCTTKVYGAEKAIDDSLSDYEKKVLTHYKNGESYAEIAEKLQSKVKSVDTAIQRIRKKALKIKQKIEEGEADK